MLERQILYSNKPIKGTDAETSISVDMADACFAMPDILPNDIHKLKWLIFQNIDMQNKDPENIKVYKENIKMIKAHIKTNSI